MLLRRFASARSILMMSSFYRGFKWVVQELCRLRTGKKTFKFEPLTQFAKDPVGFAKHVLGVRLWRKQREILRALVDNPRVAVAACYASGKTFLTAVAILWWVYTREPAMVVVTAPTFRQVKVVMFRQIKQLFRAAKRRLPGDLTQTKLEIGPGQIVFGFTSDGENQSAGLHQTKNVFFVQEECAGITEEMDRGFDGVTATEDSRHLRIGNPLCSSGPFYDTFEHPEETKRWEKFSIDAEQTPNVRAKKNLVHGLVPYEWVEDKRVRWLKRGLLHLWMTKVKGEFWVTAADKLIPSEWIKLAQERFADAVRAGLRRLGSDIAAGGADTSQHYLREGQAVRYVHDEKEEDVCAQAKTINSLCETHEVDESWIDATGVGQGTYNRAQELANEGEWRAGCEIHGVKLYMPAIEKDTFCTRQDEIQWHLREALDPNGDTKLAIDPDDKELADQLGWREWSKCDRTGRIRVTGKKELKKQGKPSPDKADGVSLTTIKRYQQEVWWSGAEAQAA